MWRLRPVIGLTLLALVLWKAGAGSVVSVLGAADPRFFGVAVAAYGICQLLSSARWALILRALRAPQRLSRLFGLYLVGMFFNQLLPGSIGGDVAKVAALRTPEAGISVVLERLLGLAALLGLAGAAALSGTRIDARLGMLGALLLAVLALAFALLRALRYQRPLLKAISEALRALPLAALLAPLLVAVLVQLGNVGVYLLLAKALHLGLPAGAVTAFYVATTLAALAPISLGGLGVRELSGALALRPFGVAADSAVALALLWTASATFWALCGGALFTRSASARSTSASAHSPAPPP